MWRSQLAHLAERSIDAVAVELPGHGSRMTEPFALDLAMAAIDETVQDAARRGPVLLVGHSMGGLLSVAYAGAEHAPAVAGFIGASCTAFPRGAGLAAYRALTRTFNSLPDQGQWLTKQMLAVTLPVDTRADFAAGGYAFDAQDIALGSLRTLDLASSLHRLRMPLWWINGQFDQLRMQERLFHKLTPQSELIVVPRTSHLVTAMRPRVFNAVLDLAIATLEQDDGHEQSVARDAR